jgi:hypothetical protein
VLKAADLPVGSARRATVVNAPQSVSAERDRVGNETAFLAGLTADGLRRAEESDAVGRPPGESRWIAVSDAYPTEATLCHMALLVSGTRLRGPCSGGDAASDYSCKAADNRAQDVAARRCRSQALAEPFERS